jgi:HD-like signal output (HDOD) protein
VTFGRDQILQALERAHQLPSFPEVVVRLERELSRPDASVQKVVPLLQEDAILVAQVLRVANSVFNAGKSPIVSIEQAAVRLGLRELRRVVYAGAVIQRWRTMGSVNPERFWSHSLAVGLAGRAVSSLSANRGPEAQLESVYVAGLLHDLGAMVVMHLFPEEYSKILAILSERGGTASEHELVLWGIDHGEVGGILAARWALPQAIQEAIQFHHQPWLAGPEQRDLVRLVHIADFVCNNQGLGRDGSGFPNWFDAASWDALGLSLDQSEAIIGRVRAEGDNSVVLAKALVT